MPKAYGKIRDKFIEQGKPVKKAKEMAAKIYNSEHPDNPVGRYTEEYKEKIVSTILAELQYMPGLLGAPLPSMNPSSASTGPVVPTPSSDSSSGSSGSKGKSKAVFDRKQMRKAEVERPNKEIPGTRGAQTPQFKGVATGKPTYEEIEEEFGIK